MDFRKRIDSSRSQRDDPLPVDGLKEIEQASDTPSTSGEPKPTLETLPSAIEHQPLTDPFADTITPTAAAELALRQRSDTTDTPHKLGNYTILRKIGAGGMGQVFLAEHRRLQRAVALKTLPETALDSPQAIHRFEREVKAAARLNHPNLVVAYDADEANGTHFLVMEYVDGEDLASLVNDRGPLPVAEAIDCILQAARGMSYAHKHGVTHCDIKPSNMLLDQQGTVKVLDLGLAQLDSLQHGDGELTLPDTVMGAVDYMSPEQALDSQSADWRSDVYSLGCTLHYLLTGRAPFGGNTLTQKLLAHRDQPIPSSREGNPDIPAVLSPVFQRLMAKKPDDRYQSMDEVIAALESVERQQRAPLAASRVDPIETAVAVPVNNLSQPETNRPTGRLVSRSRRWLFIAGGTVLTAVAILATLWALAAILNFEAK